MSLLDIGPNVTKIPIERNNGSSGLVTKIPIERVDKGKCFTAQLFFAFFFIVNSSGDLTTNSEFSYFIIFLFYIWLEPDKSLFSTKITYAKKKISIKNERKGMVV